MEKQQILALEGDDAIELWRAVFGEMSRLEKLPPDQRKDVQSRIDRYGKLIRELDKLTR